MNQPGLFVHSSFGAVSAPVDSMSDSNQDVWLIVGPMPGDIWAQEPTTWGNQESARHGQQAGQLHPKINTKAAADELNMFK